MTAAWLFPIVPMVVTAATGGVVASVLSAEPAVITLVVSYMLWWDFCVEAISFLWDVCTLCVVFFVSISPLVGMNFMGTAWCLHRMPMQS